MTHGRHDEGCEHPGGVADGRPAFGVQSYWIVVPDVRRPELTVFELAGGRYQESGHVVGDQRFGATRPFPVEVVPARLVDGLSSGA